MPSTHPHRLTRPALTELPRSLQVPNYDPESLVPAIVHIGVGGFHRAHQAVYLDDLACRGERAWGEIGVCLRRPEMRERLEPQDNLFTVVAHDQSASEARVVGAMSCCLYAPDDPEAVLDALTDPRTRVVTLTITGTAYHVDEWAGRFDATAPEVVADLADPTHPSSAFGYLAEALDRRRRAGTAPFTVLSCDNLQDNGAAAHTALCGFAHLRDPELAEWIDTNVAFPSCMVDRITPAAPAAARRLLLDRFEIDDRAAVLTEPYRKWIIEDRFCNGRPPLDRVGARFVEDVRPYKLVKSRMLNGAHCALGYLATLDGFATTHEALADPVVHDYLEALLRDEIAPVLEPPAGVDLDAYRESLLHRFANPEVGDRLARLCARGSTKMPSYLLPSLRDARAAGRTAPLLVLALAGWVRYLRGVDLEGSPFEVEDANAVELRRLVDQGTGVLLRRRSLFGDLADDRALVGEVGDAIAAIDRLGARGAMLAAAGLTSRVAS